MIIKVYTGLQTMMTERTECSHIYRLPYYSAWISVCYIWIKCIHIQVIWLFCLDHSEYCSSWAASKFKLMYYLFLIPKYISGINEETKIQQMIAWDYALKKESRIDTAIKLTDCVLLFICLIVLYLSPCCIIKKWRTNWCRQRSNWK